MSTPFKMKGMSFGNSPMKQTKGPVMPKNHPVTPPTEEQSKKSKGTVKQGSMIRHGRWNRPEVWEDIKTIHTTKFKKILENPNPSDQIKK